MGIPYQKFLFGILFLSCLCLSFVSFFNWFIDPYGIWESPRFKRVNEYIYNGGSERLFKMIQVARKDKIEILFIGSSCVKKSLYPKTYYDLCGGKVYNAAFDAAHILEMKYLLQQTILFHPELQQVVLCLNFLQFDKSLEGSAKEFPVHQLGWKTPVMKEMFCRLVSRVALARSMAIFDMNYHNKLHCNFFDQDGNMNLFWLQKEYERSNNLEEFSIDTIKQIPMFKKFHISIQNQKEYAEIVNLCAENNIELLVYINPVHNIFLEGIYESGAGRAFEEWKRWLVSVHPVYDFAHYSKIGNEPFSTKRLYWRNTQHPMPLTGDLVLQKLAGEEKPEDVGVFGFLLAEKNVEEILQMERKKREIWREENPETVWFVRDLVKRY